jgi:hypothetical protein
MDYKDIEYVIGAHASRAKRQSKALRRWVAKNKIA